jgi:peptidoglycan/LPS O-acetylase OafA/YrhL
LTVTIDRPLVGRLSRAGPVRFYCGLAAGSSGGSPVMAGSTPVAAQRYPIPRHRRLRLTTWHAPALDCLWSLQQTSPVQPISYADFKAMRRFPALDGLRAIAAVLVFVFHFGGPGSRWLSGWIGVHLFFVLSGFLITTLMLREEERYGRVSLRAFYTRRFFRIMPVYLVVLAATWAIAHVRGTGAVVEKALPYYLLLLNEFGATGSFIHSWTIGIEQKFYIFWPVIAFVLVVGAFRKRLAITVTLMALLVAAIPPDIAWLSWPIHYVAILVGCLLAVVMNNPRGYALVRPLTHPVTATVVVIGFIAFHCSAQYWPTTFGQESLIGVYAVAVGILLPALLSHSIPAKLLALRPMVFVGERSYSLYLVQDIAAKTVVGLVPSIAHRGSKFVLATLVVGLLAADLLYRWVEQPMIELGRRLAQRHKKANPAEAADAPAPTAEAPALTTASTR